MELDAGLSVDGISQNVQTLAGQNYELRFHMRARIAGNINSASELVLVDWRNTNIGQFKADSANQWVEIVVSPLVGSGGQDQLALRESSDGNNGAGPLIDNVRLFAIN